MDIRQHERALEKCDNIRVSLYEQYNTAIKDLILELEPTFGMGSTFKCDHSLYMSNLDAMCILRIVQNLPHSNYLVFVFIDPKTNESFRYNTLSLGLDALRSISSYFLKRVRDITHLSTNDDEEKEVFDVIAELRVQGIVQVDASSVSDYEEACDVVKQGFRANLGEVEIMPGKGITSFFFMNKLETNIL